MRMSGTHYHRLGQFLHDAFENPILPQENQDFWDWRREFLLDICVILKDANSRFDQERFLKDGKLNQFVRYGGDDG